MSVSNVWPASKPLLLCRTVCGVIAAVVVAGADNPVHAGLVRSPTQTYATICMWDQPGQVGHMLCLAGTGTASLASFELDPANPALGTWQGAVQSYLPNDTHGFFAIAFPRRREYFGPNYSGRDAGQFAAGASHIIVQWSGWDQLIQTGSIVSIGHDVPTLTTPVPHCLDLGGRDSYGNREVALVECQEWSDNQVWQYIDPGGTLFHPETGMCLDATGRDFYGPYPGFRPVLKPCNGGSDQSWSWDSWRRVWKLNGTSRCFEHVGGQPAYRQVAIMGYCADPVYEQQQWLPYFYSSAGEWYWP